ncbi:MULTISPECIES: glycosyltransferase [Vibrio]|uniref:glycosyltransferase n=1 Tax=Vibrio TaxID=662 RepID=UPI00107FCB95|nr:glycosyltransferase [Vibrio tasmaniensis]
MCDLSVIVPLYNAEKYLLSYFDKNIPIFDQLSRLHFDIELLFVDGVSNDQTLAIINENLDEREYIKLMSEEDEGIYDAMNNGVNSSRGKYIYFMGVDDVLSQGFVDIFERAFPECENIDIFYGYVTLLSSGSSYIRMLNKGIVYKNVCHQAMFFKRELLLNSPYDLKYTLLSDWEKNMYFSTFACCKFYDFNIALYNDLDGRSSNNIDVEFKSDRNKIIHRNYGFGGVIYSLILRFFDKFNKVFR